MRRVFGVIALLVMTMGWFAAPAAVLAQSTTPTAEPTVTPIATPSKDIAITTPYPLLVVGVGDVTTLDLDLSAGISQTVKLEMKQQPQDWKVTFRGGGQLVGGAYVTAGQDATVQMTIEQPANVAAGSYDFVVLATGETGTATLPVSLTVQEKLPPKLTLTTDLPTLQGSPSTTFSYNLTLTNAGEDDLNVTLTSQAPSSFQVSFTLNGQSVTSFPVAAHATKNISVSLQPLSTVAAGSYTADITAQGGPASANLQLTAEVTGQSSLSVTTPDGRLSGQVTLGQTTPFKVDVVNNGSADARQVNLTASAPAGWKVEFDPAQVGDIPAGQQVEVTANVTPNDQAIAGDYQVTINANETGGATKSADFRFTVVTSTLWGLAGVALIAVAVGVVAAAVLRFGRR